MDNKNREHDEFENPGRQIKAVIKVIIDWERTTCKFIVVVLGCILIMLDFIAISCESDEYGEISIGYCMLVIMCSVLIFGLILWINSAIMRSLRFKYLKLYAYGQLVENSDKILNEIRQYKFVESKQLEVLEKK